MHYIELSAAFIFVFGWLAVLLSWAGRRRTKRVYRQKNLFYRTRYEAVWKSLTDCREIRNTEHAQMARLLDENEKLRKEGTAAMLLLRGVNNLVRDLSGPQKLGDPQLPGNHPFVYGMNDQAKKVLIDRLAELMLPDDYTKFRP